MSIAYFDGVIVGGGLVGAALAVALAEQGKEIALLELRPPQLDLQAAFTIRKSNAQRIFVAKAMRC